MSLWTTPPGGKSPLSKVDLDPEKVREVIESPDFKTRMEERAKEVDRRWGPRPISMKTLLTILD